MEDQMSKGSAILILDMPESEYKRGLGVLIVQRNAQKSNLPLASVDIKARVADRIAQVDVSQKFHNPFSEHLEAVYIFPLAPGCAVSKFIMKVGDRIIAGKIDERAEARQQYAQAMQEGRRAALLEQERDDVFTVQVGNIPPGEEITVEITYSERLPFFSEGTTEIRLPLVVAPRFIPGMELNRDSVGTGIESDTDKVPDASRITPPRLANGSPAKVALNIEVELFPGTAAQAGNLADLTCSQHAVQTVTEDGATNISLLRENERLNRDFVLRWRMANEKVRSSFVYVKDPETDWYYGMLSLVPPAAKKSAQKPRDVIFILDRSGSMQGIKMTSAVRACSILLNTLGPSDRFAIQLFDDRVDWMNSSGVVTTAVNPQVTTSWWEEGIRPQSSSPSLNHPYFVDADESGIQRGNDFLRKVQSRGGTQIDIAMQSALQVVQQLNSGPARIPVIVLLTDGQVGHEGIVLNRVQTNAGSTRIFTVGIDTAVNEGFLRRLADIGRGTATFVQPGTKVNH